MYVGNVMLLVLNLPLVPLFAQILRLPPFVLMPGILGVCLVGVLSAGGGLFDAGLLVLFGVLGYAMRKLDYPTAPLVLGVVLGDSMERALRQSLMMSQGELSILVSRPISAVMLCLAAVILFLPVIKRFNRWRTQAIDTSGDA